MEMIMSHFEKRLKEYANPSSRSHWHGQGRDKENLRRWAERASENSDGHLHRARDGEIELPPTGIGPPVTDRAGAGSGVGRVDAAHREARRDLNHRGGTHMKGVRRTTG
jgi:hypothetical protein